VDSTAPDRVLVTGDLVQIGLESEIIEAADWLRSLGPAEKVMLVPGNHDNYAIDSLPALHRHWADYLPSAPTPAHDYTAGYPLVRECNGVKLLGVNTSCVTRIFSAAGELGEGQRQRLVLLLEKPAGEDEFRCLLIHHPPFPGMTRRRKALRDAGQLLEIVSRSALGLVLYGHLHHNRENIHGGTRSYCTASASSTENASYRIFDLEKEASGWHCRMQLMTLDRGSSPYAGFKRMKEFSWQVPGKSF
jgi:3',5'-cyclic AMP phosphodiesterase CpdA